MRGLLIWLTGLPCAGKTTIAAALADELVSRGHAVEVLDGDVVRQHLSQGLGYSRADRETNVRRIGFVSGLLVRHGVIVVVAAVSPHAAVRAEVRREVGAFFEVHVDCPVQECERRDVKGMYALARCGKIAQFTGVDDGYEPPPAPEARVDTASSSLGACVSTIVQGLERGDWIARVVSTAQPQRAGRRSSVDAPRLLREERTRG